MLSGPPAPFILFDDARPKGAGEARLYTDPVEIVTAHAPETVGDSLDRIASAGKRGLHAAGTIAYRSEEHTSELQSLMRISYAFFCLTQQKQSRTNDTNN